METVPIKKSILEMPPSNEGGPVGRQGQQYQDVVGIPILLEMLTDDAMELVEFETHDDVLIVRKEDTQSIVEFVQVKSDELNQLWSCAKLCEQRGAGKNRTGTSIFEKSLSQDKGIEVSRFRIVTKIPVHEDLSILKHPIKSDFRIAEAQKIKAVCDDIKKYFSEAKSDNGNGVEYWVQNAVWIVAESPEALAGKNYKKVDTLTKNAGYTLAPDRVTQLLSDIEGLVREAGNLKYEDGRSRKQIKRDDFRYWFNSKVNEYALGSVASEKMKEKMEQDGIAPELINSAIELRRQYTNKLRNQGYMVSVNGEALAEQARAALMAEKSKLNAEVIKEDGEKFHSRCIGILAEIDKQQPSPENTRAAFLMGCMYDITDRCQHRFSKRKSK